MKWRLLILLALAMGILGGTMACGGAATTATAAETAAEKAGPSTLKPSVDVATVYDLLDNPDVFLIDVREPFEYDTGHIPGITLIPMGDVASRLSEIPTDKEVIVTCRTGNRSAQIADFLRAQGFTNVHNMEGGIVAWEEAGYPVEQ